MELKAFIKASLVEISQAIHEANEEHKTEQRVEQGPFMLRHADQGQTTGIEFDVAVTTKAGSGAKGGITVWGFGVGGDKHKTNENASRIRFTVAIRGHVL